MVVIAPPGDEGSRQGAVPLSGSQILLWRGVSDRIGIFETKKVASGITLINALTEVSIERWR